LVKLRASATATNATRSFRFSRAICELRSKTHAHLAV
jgi:hypothetical protein